MRRKYLLACAKGPEVLCGLGYNIGKELDDDTALRLAVNCNIQEHLWRYSSKNEAEPDVKFKVTFGLEAAPRAAGAVLVELLELLATFKGCYQ